MTRTRRKRNYGDNNVEDTLDVTEKSSIQKSPETEAYESVYQKKKILWRPNKGPTVRKTRITNSKATFQDYLDDSGSSEDLGNSSADSSWSKRNTSSARKMKTVPKTTVQKKGNVETGSDEEVITVYDHPLIYSPLTVTLGKAEDEILDVLHENHVRSLERSQALDPEEDEEFVDLIPSKEITDDRRRSSTKNSTEEKKITDAQDQVRGSDIFRKPSVSFNQKTVSVERTLGDSPLKGTVRKEAKKKLFGKPSKNIPGSFSASFASVNQQHGNSTLNNRTNHIVSRFTKQFRSFDRLAFLSTPHQLRESGSPGNSAENENSPPNQLAAINNSETTIGNSVKPPAVKTKVSISFSKPGAPEIVTSYPSPIQNDMSKDRINLTQTGTTVEQPRPELPVDRSVSLEIKKATPRKRRETINELSVEESEPVTVNSKTQTSVSPNKQPKVYTESDAASVNVSITLSPLKTVDGSANLGDNDGNRSPEKSRRIGDVAPNHTLPVQDREFNDHRDTHDATQSQQALPEVEPSLDEETTAGLLFEREMRERKMKKQTPRIAPQLQSQLIKDARETNVYKQNQMNYCTTDYDAAVAEDPIQVCNITNTPLLRVNSWKLLPGMSKPVTRLGSSLCHVTVLDGKIELQVTQENGKIVKTYMSAQDVAYIPEDSVYEVKNIGAVTSVVLIYHSQGR